MSLESLYYAAMRRKDYDEANRLNRLMERLDEQRKAYGKEQRKIFYK